MSGEGGDEAPQSPETQPREVREELDQEQISHDGQARSGDDAGTSSSAHFGAVDSETTPVISPLRGPADLINEGGADTNIIDPADEITPG